MPPVNFRCDAHGDDCRAASCPKSAAPGSFSARLQHPCGRGQRTPTSIAPSPPIGKVRDPSPAAVSGVSCPLPGSLNGSPTRRSQPPQPPRQILQVPRDEIADLTLPLARPVHGRPPRLQQRHRASAVAAGDIGVDSGSFLLLLRSPLARARAAPLSRGAERRQPAVNAVAGPVAAAARPCAAAARRTHLNRVTCPLFVTTSVPLSMAMPTSALANASASLKLSPAMATMQAHGQQPRY